MENLLEKLKEVPLGAIPKIGTTPHKLLMLLLSRNVVSEDDIAYQLGLNYRGPLQRLMGSACQHWNILAIHGEDGLIKGRKLDPRHLSGDPHQDALARAERKAALAAKSHRDAMMGRVREPKALNRRVTAREELKVLKENAPVETEA